jgi:hypothetical protein
MNRLKEILTEIACRLKKCSKSPKVPGLEMVGRSIILKSHSFELKNVIFKHQRCSETFRSKINKQTYCVPKNYAVNESVLISPGDQTLGQTIVEESWESFDQLLKVDGEVAASYSIFHVKGNADIAEQLRSTQKSFYALKSSFVPLWTLYLPDTTTVSSSFEGSYKNLPKEFYHSDRRKYEQFFEQYGTHYVTKVWVGGKALLALAIAESSNLTKQQINSTLNLGFTSLVQRNKNKKQEEILNTLQRDSKLMVTGEGGNELMLSTLTPFDREEYIKWLNTVKQSPNVIAFEAAGIWTIIKDEKKAAALLEAYKAATLSTTISGIFRVGKELYFLRGRKYISYNVETNKAQKPKEIKKTLPGIEMGLEKLDTALEGFYVKSFNGKSLKNKIFLFSGDKYFRYDLLKKEMDYGYPMPIRGKWPGLTFDRIDAVLNVGTEKVYFFRKEWYTCYNLTKNKVECPPKLIREGWPGFIFERIDAAVNWGDGNAYFFRKDEYIRFSLVEGRCVGSPKKIVGSYVEDWKLFEQPPSSNIS